MAELDPHQNQKRVYVYRSVSHFSPDQADKKSSYSVKGYCPQGIQKIRNTGQTAFRIQILFLKLKKRLAICKFISLASCVVHKVVPENMEKYVGLKI